MRQLILDQLLPRAQKGLEATGMDPGVARRWLGIVFARVRSRRTGDRWQRAFVARHGADMDRLTAAYLEHQATGVPVHEWPWPE